MSEQMHPYDKKAWMELEHWRNNRLRPASGILPTRLRQHVAAVREQARERFAELPGALRFQELFIQALEGLVGAVNRVAVASLRKEAVTAAYRRHGHEIAELSDIRKLELRDVDRVKPRLDLRYILATAAEGAVAGLAVSGGELVAAAGGVFGAGAAAAPGAGTIVGVMAADATVVLVASMRAVSHIAAYYGYDVELPEERMFALGVLNVGTARKAGKSAAYRELNKIVQALARRATWDELNKNGVTQIVNALYVGLGMRITKEKLGQAVPVVGVVIGAGFNAHLLSRVTSDADQLYRQRFLCEKYGIGPPDVEAATGPDDLGPDDVAISHMLEGRRRTPA